MYHLFEFRWPEHLWGFIFNLGYNVLHFYIFIHWFLDFLLFSIPTKNNILFIKLQQAALKFSLWEKTIFLRCSTANCLLVIKNNHVVNNKLFCAPYGCIAFCILYQYNATVMWWNVLCNPLHVLCCTNVQWHWQMI